MKALLAIWLAAGHGLVCGDRVKIVDALREDHQERQTARAVAGPDILIELFAKRSGKTWTLLLTYPDGVSCLYGTGESWEAVEPRAR